MNISCNLHQMLLLKAALTLSLANRMPCQLGLVVWTKEHICPRSTFPELKNDPLNIIPLPQLINNRRQTKKYSESTQGYLYPSCSDCCKGGGWCPGMAVIGNDCRPPPVFQPLIGASVLMLADRYPHLSRRIDREVLELDLAEEWANQRCLGREEIEHIHV